MKLPPEFEGLSKRDLIRIIISQNSRITDLEKRLLAYENAHTPPSKSKERRYPKRDKGGKVGAPVGHKGVTRKTLEPTETKTMTLTHCPDCQNILGKYKRVERRVIEEIPDPQPLRVIEFLRYYYDCGNCNKEVAGNDKELPAEGNIGINLQAQIAVRKFEDRLPIRKVVQSIKRDFNIEITSGTVQDVTRRVSDKLTPKYEQLKKELVEAPALHADETGAKLNGKKHWLWVFMNRITVIFLLRPKREQKVIEKMLGNKAYKGILTCDGYKGYTNLVEKIQRCWAHLLREAKFLAQKHEGQAKILYNSLCELFKKIKMVTTATAREKRERIFAKCIKQMQLFIGIAKGYKELRKFATTMENGLQQWFTCVLNPEIEPTNNAAERELREFVVQRKIFGSFRSNKGLKIAETILSMLATWRKRNLNTYHMLRLSLSS